jgi:hypothetical protein
VARQLGHTFAVLLSTYAHLIDEYAEREPINAEAEITKARKTVRGGRSKLATIDAG